MKDIVIRNAGAAGLLGLRILNSAATANSGIAPVLGQPILAVVVDFPMDGADSPNPVRWQLWATETTRKGSDETPVGEREDRALFDALAGWWHESTDLLTSPSGKMEHEAYRRIVESGAEMVPYILENMRDSGGDWYAALREITGENPVLPEHRGRPPLMNDDWFAWARSHGYAT